MSFNHHLHSDIEGHPITQDLSRELLMCSRLISICSSLSTAIMAQPCLWGHMKRQCTHSWGQIRPDINIVFPDPLSSNHHFVRLWNNSLYFLYGITFHLFRYCVVPVQIFARTRKGSVLWVIFLTHFLVIQFMSVGSCCFMCMNVFSIFSSLHLCYTCCQTTYEHFLK